MMKPYFKQLLTAAIIGLTGTQLNAQSVTGTLQDSVNHALPAIPGDTIYYKAKLKNPSGSDANGVNYNNTTPTNTVLQPGTRTSALARNDLSAGVALNATLNIGNVLTNDFGVPAPSVVSFGPQSNPSATSAGSAGTTDGGGNLTINANGSLSYTPANNFTGYDFAKYIAGNGNSPNNSAILRVAVGNPPTATNDSYSAVGNVHIILNAAAGVKSNDGGDVTVVETVQGLTANVGVLTNTANNGQVTMQADGSFTYNPPPGFEGNDSFTYTVDNGYNTPASATVTIAVSGMIWFVNNSGANGNGRLSSPFNSLAGVSNGAGGSAAGDNIFIYTGASSYSGGIVLLSNQKLIGQGASASLASIAGVVPPSYSASLPATGGTAPVILNSGGNGVTLNSATTGNTLRGLSLQNSSGSALNGSSFGTLTIDPDVTINTTGQAISLSTGAISGNFGSVTSSGGTNNVSFGGCTGTTSFGGALSGASGTSFNVNGSTVNITYTGNITQSNNALMVSVNGHGGNITFNTGTLSATNGNGLSFSSVSGTYSFNGTTTLNGGAAHIAISTGGGTFSFGSGTSITNPAAAAFSISGGGPNVTYNGNITMSSSNNTMVSVLNQASGTVTFQTGTLSATNGSGLQFDNADGTYNFNGTTTLNGGTAAVDIINGSGGSFTFGANTDILSPGDTAFNVKNSTCPVTYNGDITQNNAQLMIYFGTHSGGNVLFQTGTLLSNGSNARFDCNDCDASSYNFNGLMQMNGGGISITNGSAGNFSFLNAPITNPIGTAFNVNGGGGTVGHVGIITKNNAGGVATIANRTGGSVTLNSNFTSTIASPGISVTGCTAGTITFSGFSKVLNTSSQTAVNINSNSNSTVNFINGNLDIDVTSATGFSATSNTNGGISVQGSNNSITATTGTALNVTSTIIAASGLTFQSISSIGSTGVGIILNTTGNTGGGFTITGTGTTPGSGGTFSQSSALATDGSITAGIGIYLNSTNNISLSNLNFSGTFGNFGIRGLTVNNFTLLESNFTGQYGTNSSGGVVESTIRFGTQGSDGTGNGLTGTALFTGNNIGGGYTDNLGIFNNNLGSLNISFADGAHPAIFSHNVTTGNVSNDAICIETRGNGGALGAGFNLTFNCTGVQFNGARGDNLQLIAASNSTHNITVLNNTFHNTHPQIVTGGGGMALNGGGSGSNYISNYNVEGNSFRGAKSSPLHFGFGGSAGTIRGTVINNIIGVDDAGSPPAKTVQDSTGASDNGNGINYYQEKIAGTGSCTHATRIQGNQIRDVTGIPIFLRSNAPGLSGTGILEATILNNIVEEVKTGNGINTFGTISSIYTQTACGGIPDVGKMGLNIRNNTLNNNNNGGATGGENNTILFDQCAAEGYHYFPGYLGGQFDGVALSNFLVAAPNSNIMTNGQTPSQPGSFVYLNAIAKNEPFVLLPVPLYAAHSPSTINKINNVSKSDVEILLNAALKRFEKSGLSKTDMEKLRCVTVTVSELPVLFLGSSDSGTITIDADAAGFGWFVDETPEDDNEFNGCDKSGLNKTTGKMDLLTVLMHELGHQIGLADDVPGEIHADLMEGSLKPGERHLSSVN